MNLTQAVAEIEGLYGPADKEFDGPDRVNVSSGGQRKLTRDPEPALYLSQELACQAWVDQMDSLLSRARVGGKFKFIEGPHLDKWAMTVTDLRGMQRVAEMRYSVTATIGVQWVTQEEVAA